MKTITFMCSSNEALFYNQNIGMRSLVTLNGVNCDIVIKAVENTKITAEVDENTFNIIQKNGMN